MTDRAQGGGNRYAGTAQKVVQAGTVFGGIRIDTSKVPLLPAPNQLPATVAHFTGREADLRQLHSLLPDDDAHEPATLLISAIAGMAGVGKTTLATYWAHRIRDRYPNGALYVNLQGYSNEKVADPGPVLGSFLRALNVPDAEIPADVASRAALFRSLLTERRVLVLLDNAATPEQIRPLLPGSPSSLVIVTSRSRLSGLIARNGARPIFLGLLSDTEAMRLLRRIAGDARIDSEPTAATALAGYCAHLPLALCIAAARVVVNPHKAIEELVAELSAERNRLDFFNTEDEETAVRAVFSWSYRSLSPDAAKMFRLLSLYPVPVIDIPGTAALAGISKKSARDLLRLLFDGHLLESQPGSAYRFHDLVLAYASECLEADEPPSSRAEALQRISGWHEYLRLREHTVAHTTEWGRATALRQAGEHALFFHWHDEAIPLLKESATIFSTIRDHRGAGLAHLGLGEAYRKLDQQHRCIQHLQKAADEFAKANCRVDSCTALHKLGKAWARAGNPGKAQGALQHTLRIMESLGKTADADLVLKELAEITADAAPHRDRPLE
ncbi:NB-ARC domain-containing protein [Amycolatopsis sp. FU40]|uniref:ATP-binding protein n=1 Tax=Amycolatopsis sp. FU40 TaxID=2914159 RepID=UPI001F011798|nr:ATP-binding protein [Amycolatopsis sp. FU40]UKD58264.1 NB-ARC domain-containing protein [Amycolatopsis sp. FU40]